MPAVSKSHPAAIACADLHLSHKPPAARATEDWYSAMGRVADELVKLKLEYKVPILCAGDVFHAHNPPPELINWAIGNIPEMYAIPGQHDLPFHAYDDIRKSAYWSLRLAGTIKHVTPEGREVGDGVWVQGFGWGQEVAPASAAKNRRLHIALVHKYAANGAGTAYVGAPSNCHVLPKDYEGYQVVVFGDNHISWDAEVKSTKQTYWNCGSLMRRNADQINHKPRVGIIYSDGHVESHYLDTSRDELTSGTPAEVDADGANAPSFAEVMDGLRGLGGTTLDFPTLCRQAMERRGTDPRVARYLLEALEHGEGTGPQTR